jgi:hypothetical protein
MYGCRCMHVSARACVCVWCLVFVLVFVCVCSLCCRVTALCFVCSGMATVSSHAPSMATDTRYASLRAVASSCVPRL